VVSAADLYGRNLGFLDRKDTYRAVNASRVSKEDLCKASVNLHIKFQN
jgi:hypothetical protein